MKLKLDMSCHLLNVYTKFQIDISKHVEKKSGKLGRTDGRTDRRTDIKSHSQSVQCTRPSHCLRQQWRHNHIQLCDVTTATQRMLLWAHVNGTEIILKSTDRRSNLSLFLYVQGLIHGCLIMFISRVIRWNCFSKILRISLPRMLQNDDLQC